MSTIVAGRFDRTLDADATLNALRQEGFSAEEIDSFYVSPPGQNAMTPLGGDAPHSSAGSRRAGYGAAIGGGLGLLVGLVFGAFASLHLGAPALWMIAGLGAFVGAFAGTMAQVRGASRFEATREHPVEPRGGRLIAICVDRAGSEPRAVAILKNHGARDLGRTQGVWRDGSWSDFDPRAPLATV